MKRPATSPLAPSSTGKDTSHLSKALRELSGASNLKDERVGHYLPTWALSCPLARRQFNNAVQYVNSATSTRTTGACTCIIHGAPPILRVVQQIGGEGNCVLRRTNKFVLDGGWAVIHVQVRPLTVNQRRSVTQRPAVGGRGPAGLTEAACTGNKLTAMVPGSRGEGPLRMRQASP